jgi:hypothetical protein
MDNRRADRAIPQDVLLSVDEKISADHPDPLGA